MNILLTGLFSLRIIDVIDIVLFAILLYEIYNLVKGTAAIRIFIGIILVYLIWKVVRALQMQLLTEILGQFISVGFIALIVVFQPEIRQFLLLVGNTRIIRNQPKRFLFWRFQIDNPVTQHSGKIVKACQKMAESHTGALIVITRQNELAEYVATGQPVEARISEALLETIFFKNSPLHDGAVIITGSHIKAARCILPVSTRDTIPTFFGLRHRAAAGIAERSDAIAIVVSEERGEISCFWEGKIQDRISPSDLNHFLENAFK
ncbi:MAG TPA: diadenylate cyclase CdaA [Bacteroidales bacterium]|nr:diadenylate cyclase CdaA [Bacteroidales bacterium]HPS63010.1 diadenylate cyclase CdaA [Bacteroidales bacterium]